MAVDMCCAHVQGLELSEPGWQWQKTLRLQIIRNPLLERDHDLVETPKIQCTITWRSPGKCSRIYYALSGSVHWRSTK